MLIWIVGNDDAKWELPHVIYTVTMSPYKRWQH